MIDWKKFRARFAWLPRSRKAQIALGAIAFVLLARLLPKVGFTPAECEQITTSVKTIASVWIAAIAVEDAANGQTSPPSSTGGSQSPGEK